LRAARADLRVRVAFPPQAEQPDHHGDGRCGRHGQEVAGQWDRDGEDQLPQTTVGRRAEEHVGTDRGDREHQRRLHHRPEQTVPTDQTDGRHASHQVPHLVDLPERVRSLHVDESGDSRHAEAEYDGSPPRHSTKGANDRALVPRQLGV
jgi:hypothetical protein